VTEPAPEVAPERRRSLGLLAYIAVGVVAVIAAVFALTAGGEEEPPDAAPPGATATTAGPDAPAAPAGTGSPQATSAPPVGGTTPPATAPGGLIQPPDGVMVDRNPLNGTPLDGASANRVIAVKVDNVGDARPQLGLLEAEMIIETPVEGGLTRFTALYFSERPNGVGPVRSVRPVDVDLLAPFDPVLVSTGGRPFVLDDLATAGIEAVDTGRPELFQAIERVAPHNQVATVALIAQEFAEGAPVVAPFLFGDTPLAGEPATAIDIPFSSVREVEWRYDGAQFVRYENGEEFGTLIEAGRIETQPLTTDTVLVLMVAQRSAGYQDSAGADVPTFDVIGFGTFYALSGGTLVTGEWRRAAQSDGYFLVGSDGSLVTLPVGKVFVEIVPRFVEVETS
jgi:hypothetical protein